MGSVAKDGNRVRITVQLVDAASGLSYRVQMTDRELTDVFAVQSEIAESVAKSFRRKSPNRAMESREPTAYPASHELHPSIRRDARIPLAAAHLVLVSPSIKMKVILLGEMRALGRARWLDA